MNSISDELLYQKFKYLGRKATEAKKQFCLLLPIVDRKKIWKEAGFSSIYDYAEQLSGLTREEVDEALGKI